MADPRSARTIDECLEIAAASAGNYPECLAWQLCIEPLLPPVPDPVEADGLVFHTCIAFLVDDEIGPHFVFAHAGDECVLAEVLVSEVAFDEPFSDCCALWLAAFTRWRNGRTHRRRKPLRSA